MALLAKPDTSCATKLGFLTLLLLSQARPPSCGPRFQFMTLKANPLKAPT